MKIDFSNKTTIVVGGSRGIGLKVKEKFSSLGSEVHSISRTEGVDISIPEQVDKYLMQFKKIDFLINVVGINYTKKIQEIELSEWEEVIKTNLTSIFYVTKQCISKMDQGSRIVNVSSIAGRNRSLVSGVHYTSSKSGLSGTVLFFPRIAVRVTPGSIIDICIPNEDKSWARFSLSPSRAHLDAE